MSGVTYDTGALVAAEAGDRVVWALHLLELRNGRRPVVPAGVLAQAWRGGPQANLSRLLRGCRFEELSEDRARAAGVACARSGVKDVVDASVAVGALSRADVVVTSDARDLTRIAWVLRRRLPVRRI